MTALPPRIARPTYDVAALRTGVVHLGVGAFHRAHQALYLDGIARLGLQDWGVRGIGLRTNSHREELAGQNFLYTALALSAGEPTARVVGVLRDYLPAGGRTGAAAAVAALTDPRTLLVTLTVTAPAYAVLPGGGTAVPASAFDLLARALGVRRRTGQVPFTVLSCDNLPGNGDAARRCVVAAAEEFDPGLARWIERHVGFPNSMADRITPPTTEEHRRLLHGLGVHDRAPVVTEPFSQWVVEDSFAGPRPPLEDVGVEVVTDARPYVEAKMRLLNAGHVALGFLGETTPHSTTDAAMADPFVGPLVERMLAEEVCPLLDPVPGLDTSAYLRDVLDRFRNPAIADPLARLRRRGSVRMANYVLPSLERAVLAGRPHALLTGVVATWIDHLRRSAQAVLEGRATSAEVADRLADPSLAALLGPASRAGHDVRPFLAAAGGFERLAARPDFVVTLQRALIGREVEDRAAAS
ncbi:mannitol dehydrogenase family protein [Nocardioides marmotae]|uniref:mannitol dehydrogenase family protein n=1 Tax=Nocardioides marmotae TaxID=2663857 RepID=UPI00149563E2|nr:mannitol dehydrogenase family protein [Nocardioides marmotae]MBC9734754.1 mannitol dehydrogenase family protein [Nocardioides marmotae]QKE00701.1 mannitol dehydrogenase family protein [Nocardioides marmotae]